MTREGCSKCQAKSNAKARTERKPENTNELSVGLRTSDLGHRKSRFLAALEMTEEGLELTKEVLEMTEEGA